LKSCKRNKQRRGMNFVLRSQDPARSRGLRITMGLRKVGNLTPALCPTRQDK
jgi:hypothetical protein